jgi:hypothetical protein
MEPVNVGIVTLNKEIDFELETHAGKRERAAEYFSEKQSKSVISHDPHRYI